MVTQFIFVKQRSAMPFVAILRQIGYSRVHPGYFWLLLTHIMAYVLAKSLLALTYVDEDGTSFPSLTVAGYLFLIISS